MVYHVTKNNKNWLLSRLFSKFKIFAKIVYQLWKTWYNLIWKKLFGLNEASSGAKLAADYNGTIFGVVHLQVESQKAIVCKNFAVTRGDNICFCSHDPTKTANELIF